MVFDHIGFNVSDFPTTRAFLVAALAPLGNGITQEGPGWAMIGRPGEGNFWFGASVIGPDGHNFEAVCHAEEASP